ncbi:MAG TPA: hypothetical protein VMU47_10965 [Caldimonas sp.]|nr:hypothetical protein [Caldimonas sp.]
MKIPSSSTPQGAADRLKFYQDLVVRCSRTRQERLQFYQLLRSYFLFGTPDASGCDYNNIASTIETRWSLMYSPTGARFSLHLGSTAPPEEIYKTRPLVHELNDQWRMGKSHMVFDLGGKWAHVFGCMIFKVIWKRGVARTYLVEPHQFGVLREDKIDLEDQEAFCLFYTNTQTQLESDLEGHPRKDEIMAQVKASPTSTDAEHPISSAMSRLIVASQVATTSPAGSPIGGSIEGGIPNAISDYDYSPVVDVPLVDMVELYVWNDEIEDYQMVTMAGPTNVIFDRRQPGVAGIPNFVKIAPEANLYDYFWGASYVAKLAKLQDWRTAFLEQLKAIMSKQADPPVAASGWVGITEEKWAAVRTAGGLVSAPGAMNTKLEKLAGELPTGWSAILDVIDKMFNDTAGIGHILQGKGEPGVRSKGQADLLARLGSSRPKSAAIIVEEAAEALATLIMRCIQDNSKQRFVAHIPKRPGVLTSFLSRFSDSTVSDGTPLTFTAAQFTNDFEVKVDAHSSSPIFFEDRKNDAVELFDRQCITKERLIDAFDLPDKQLTLEELKGIEEKEAAEKQAQQQQAQPGAPGAKPSS